MSANAVLQIPAAPTLWERYFDRGVRDRGDLLSNARKVRRSLALVPSGDLNVPPLIAVLDRILAEGARWNDRSVGMAEERGSLVARLPETVDVPLDVLVRWSDNIKDLSIAVARLGTYCHFALKEQRRKAAAQAPQTTPGEYAALKRKNALLNHLEILLGRTRLSSYPLRLEIDPTNECNLRCRACQHGITKDFLHTELSPAYLDLLEEALPFADYAYVYGRGEPTMATALPRLIETAAQYQVRIDLLTNGTLIDRVTLPWQSLHRIGISIDGATEDTMRTLRPVAPLARVLEAMKQLRARAPQATLYTKITVSRLNFEEIPALVEQLAGAGVNEVLIHSLHVFHDMHEAIQVREGDRSDMARAVEEATRLAAAHGIKLTNAMHFDAVARPQDGGRNRPAMFQILKDTPLPVLEIRDPAELRPEIESLASAFEYYPEPLIDAAGLKPVPVAARPGSEAVLPENIDKTIRELVRQAREITPARAVVPYCFAPWKMPLISSDGRGHACCHLYAQFADFDQSDSFHHFWSSDGYARLRDSMFRTENLPDGCVSCRAHERSMLSTDTLAVADMLDVPIRRAPNHPMPMDVAALVARKARHTWFETMDDAKEVNPGRFVIPPASQIFARFPNPKHAAGVYYRGRFRFRGGSLFVGVKPVGGNDFWNYRLEQDWVELLGNSIGLPMPQVPIDFASAPQEECCLFLWAPSDNPGPVEVTISNYSGIATAPLPSGTDSVHREHFWSSR